MPVLLYTRVHLHSDEHSKTRLWDTVQGRLRHDDDVALKRSLVGFMRSRELDVRHLIKKRDAIT